VFGIVSRLLFRWGACDQGFDHVGPGVKFKLHRDGYHCGKASIRFWVSFLEDGIDLILVSMGVYAMPEVIAMAMSGTSIAGDAVKMGKGMMDRQIRSPDLLVT
jgi:hypothetical protein